MELSDNNTSRVDFGRVNFGSRWPMAGSLAGSGRKRDRDMPMLSFRTLKSPGYTLPKSPSRQSLVGLCTTEQEKEILGQDPGPFALFLESSKQPGVLPGKFPRDALCTGKRRTRYVLRPARCCRAERPISSARNGGIRYGGFEKLQMRIFQRWVNLADKKGCIHTGPALEGK